MAERRSGNPADRPIISGNEEYEVTHLAAQAGVSLNQAYELIRRHGLDREKLLAAARALKSAS